jgi:hypothetical protein
LRASTFRLALEHTSTPGVWRLISVVDSFAHRDAELAGGQWLGKARQSPGRTALSKSVQFLGNVPGRFVEAAFYTNDGPLW